MTNKEISNAPEPIKPISTGGYFHKPKPPTIPPADYETWCRADLWTIERAILLLLNAETLPVKDYFSGRCKTRNEQVIYDDFMKIWAIAKSSLKTGVLTKIDKGYPELYSEVLPGDFIAWARSKDYSIPAKLESIDSMKQAETVPEKQHEKLNRELNIATTNDGTDETLANLFDPVKKDVLEKMFPANGRWGAWAERAKANGLIAARGKRAMFNPYKAAMWLLSRGEKGYDLARINRILKKNLPPRSRDDGHLIDGELD